MSSSSDESEDVISTLPDTNAAKNEHLLPAKSREKYIATYEKFITWRTEKNTSSFCEDILMAYFEEIATKYKPSSLWAIYSMLKISLKSNHGVNMEECVKLSAFLKKRSKGYVCKKAKALTIENVDKFIDEAPDDKYLATKVALILGVTGSLRSQELSEITTNDVENHGEVFLIKVPHIRDRIQGSFVIQGKYYNIVKKYQNLRTVKKGVSTRFFQQFRKGKCSAQVIGKNKFGMMPREIAEFLNLPDAKDYTGHSFRKAATTAPDRSLGDFNLKRQVASKLTNQRYTDKSINDSGGREKDPLSQVVQQCRFCGDFSNDCVAVSSDMTYLAGNKTTLALNDTSVQLDFNDRTLPNTVCRNCDAKLQRFCEFVKLVKAAQSTLINVAEEKEDIDTRLEFVETTTEFEETTTEFTSGAESEEAIADFEGSTAEYVETETLVVKTEYCYDDKEGIVDHLAIGETVIAKKTHKRKSDTDTAQPKKQKAKEIWDNDLVIGIKEEVVENETNEPSEVSDTGTDVKPSELELANSAFVFKNAGNETSEYKGYPI